MRSSVRRHIRETVHCAAVIGEEPGPVSAAIGLMRGESISNRPAGTMGNLFADLKALNRAEVIGDYPERHLQGARLSVDRAEGHGTWELYRLDRDVYVVAMEGAYDAPRSETVPGEGLVEMHLRLSGVLEMSLPGMAETLTVRGPKLLVMHQPAGLAVSERLLANRRDASVTLYCKPRIFDELARRSGIKKWQVLEAIERSDQQRVWFQVMDLTPTLNYIAQSLLDSPYQGSVRLLYAEAKALEILCDILATTQGQEAEEPRPITSESDARRLERTRQLVASNLSKPLTISDLASAAGISESKLKRTFKSRFGVTVFEYGLECRMKHALELLRCKRMSVGQVAHAAGYNHQTSFASAFQEYFGFLPSHARTQMR